MREIKFRGKRVDNGEWVYGDLTGGDTIHTSPSTYSDFGETQWWGQKVSPETIGQYTGIKDKHGKEVYEGDVVRYREPYRTTQTHEGDNIPNGSYTEPMEPGIKTVEGAVVFVGAMFALYSEEQFWGVTIPLNYNDREWTLPEIKEAVRIRDTPFDWFENPEEGDLCYLITECAGVTTEQELIDYLSGIEVIGNIHDQTEDNQ